MKSTHPAKPYLADFTKAMRKHLTSYKDDVRRAIDNGRTAQQAIREVFKKRNLREAIVKLTLDSVLKAHKLGAKHGRRR